MAEMEGVLPSRRAWCVGKNRENGITYVKTLSSLSS